MKKMIVALVGLMFAATAYADKEASKSTKETGWTNPVNGTKHTKRTHKEKVKNGNGSAEADVTEKTKEKTDGTVEKKVEVDAESSNKK